MLKTFNEDTSQNKKIWCISYSVNGYKKIFFLLWSVSLNGSYLMEWSDLGASDKRAAFWEEKNECNTSVRYLKTDRLIRVYTDRRTWLNQLCSSRWSFKYIHTYIYIFCCLRRSILGNLVRNLIYCIINAKSSCNLVIIYTLNISYRSSF